MGLLKRLHADRHPGVCCPSNLLTLQRTPVPKRLTTFIHLDHHSHFDVVYVRVASPHPRIIGKRVKSKNEIYQILIPRISNYF
jgi:hypothetical protein